MTNAAWKNCTITDEGESFRIKRIEVAPGKRLSFQNDLHRSEHLLGGGIVKVTLNDRQIIVKIGEAADIIERYENDFGEMK